MAIIPAGTTNDYARALKIPRDNIKAAAEVIKKNQTVKMDIGHTDDSYFINIAAGGYLTELTYEVPEKYLRLSCLPCQRRRNAAESKTNQDAPEV